jgi:hypothetical protein
MGEWPLVIGYYTIGNGYADEASRLFKSCAKFNLDCELESIPEVSWLEATCYKPTFLLKKACEHPNRKLFYLDVDAEVVASPDYLFNWDGEFAVPYVDWSDYGRRPRKELISAAILFRSNVAVMDLLRLWIRQNVEFPHRRFGDQENLQDIIGPALEGRSCPQISCMVEKLPDRYSQIFDLMAGVEEPVVRQWQASRRLRA